MTCCNSPSSCSAPASSAQWSDFSDDEELDDELIESEDDSDVDEDDDDTKTWMDEDDCRCEHDPGIAMSRSPLDPNVAHDLAIIWFDGDEETLPAVATYVDGSLQNWSFQASDMKDYDGEEYADGLMDGLAMGGLNVSLTRYRYHMPMVLSENPPQLFTDLDKEELSAVPD